MDKELKKNNSKNEVEHLLELAREEKINEEEILKQSIEEKNALLKELENKNKEMYKQILTLKADFDNYRKRVEKEKQEKYFLGKVYVLGKIISLYDIFSCAVKSFEEGTDHKNIVDGVKMIYNEFESFLKKEGVEKIDCVGKRFNPLHHEILEFEDSENEDVEDNTIVSVLVEGYKVFNGKEEVVLRPAKVKVIRKCVIDKETKNEQEASNNKGDEN